MTTRIRRTKTQQASDILTALLHKQEAQVAMLKTAYDIAQAKASQTRLALATLSFECTCYYNPENGFRLDIICPVHDGIIVVPSTPIRVGGTGDDWSQPQNKVVPRVTGAATTVANAEANQVVSTEVHLLPPPRPHRQRIGEKAPSSCAHERTGIVDRVRRCLVCNEQV